jgi:preprotein translocase subunit YajC
MAQNLQREVKRNSGSTGIFRMKKLRFLRCAAKAIHRMLDLPNQLPPIDLTAQNMNGTCLIAILAMGAPAAQSGQPGATPNPLLQMVPFILMIVVFYFILIRPQQKKAKQHQELLKQLKSGDRVVTGSGIIGTIISVKERSVSLRSADTKLEVLKSAISEVTDRSGESTEV